MKLFSWMQRKSKTDITSTFKDSATGLKSSLDNQGIYVIPSNNSTLKWQPQNSHYFKDLNPENYEELNTSENDEIFPGFLTIGTLSVETVEPPTPTFGVPDQETSEEEIANINYDLKLISENLEKFLKAEAEMEGKNKLTCNKSQASTITFSDEVKEEVSNAAHQLYPLQGYLLGSSTEQCGPKETKEKGKVSLNGLFKRSKIMKRISFREDEESGQKAAKINKSSNHLTNKMLHKPPMVTKLNKIKSLFHKKIHPEISKAAGEDNDFSKYENEMILNKFKSAIRKSNKIGCWTSLTNGKKYRPKSDLISSPDAINKINLDLPTKEMAGYAGREHWVKTDAEYFVLELQENGVHS